MYIEIIANKISYDGREHIVHRSMINIYFTSRKWMPKCTNVVKQLFSIHV